MLTVSQMAQCAGLMPAPKPASCVLAWGRGGGEHDTSGAWVSRGSFSSLSLELLSLSESEELSDSLLSDSALLECAEATGSGSV